MEVLPACRLGREQGAQSLAVSGVGPSNISIGFPPTFGDFDIGFMLDYDHDPDTTKDMVLTNGNNTSEFYVFANRSSPTTSVKRSITFAS